jgi:nucleoside-diphosphate-sugar epimerase
MQRIAILGATGHIGRALTDTYARRDNVHLELFSRRPYETAAAYAGQSRMTHRDLRGLNLSNVDIVINAIGIGDPARVPEGGRDIYKLTMQIEDAIDQALTGNSRCLTVFVSSGAVYGALVENARAGTPATHPIDSPRPADWYGLSKLAAELRHRAQGGRRIVDIRIFGFLSPQLNLKAAYFMSAVYQALLSGSKFITTGIDMTRDYIGAKELVSIIDAAAEQLQINTPLDTYTKSPAGKFEILRRLERLGLCWQVSDENAEAPDRINYFSEYRKAETIGYHPERSSADVVEEVARELISSK